MSRINFEKAERDERKRILNKIITKYVSRVLFLEDYIANYHKEDCTKEKKELVELKYELYILVDMVEELENIS